jgi:Lipoprotein NlpI, contains TPR repeats
MYGCDDHVLLHLGNARLSSGKLDMAKKYFENELKNYKNSAEAYYGLGRVALDKEEYTDAVKDFTKALEINPNMAVAYFGRSIAWVSIGNIENALTDVNKGIALNSRNAPAYALRGSIYLLKKEYNPAIDDYNTALAIDQTNEWLYLQRAIYWYTVGNFSNAVSDLEKAFKLRPSNFTVLNDFAWILATCSDKSYRNGFRAVKFAEKAVKASRSAETLNTLAAAYAEAGRFDDAVRIQKESIDSQNKTGSNFCLSDSVERLKSYQNRIAWTDYARKSFILTHWGN